MKRWFRCAALVLLGVAAGLAAAWIFRNSLLRAFTEYRVFDATGLETRIGRWQSSPHLVEATLRDLRLLNPPAFGPEPLLVAPELRFELDAASSLAGRIRFKEAWVHLSEFNLVRAVDGRLNLDDVERVVRERLNRRRRTARWLEPDFAGIDRLHVTLGRVNFIDRRRPERSRAFELGITNELVTTIHSEDDFHAWLASLTLRLAVEELYRHPEAPRRKVIELIRRALARMITRGETPAPAGP